MPPAKAGVPASSEQRLWKLRIPTNESAGYYHIDPTGRVKWRARPALPLLGIDNSRRHRSGGETEKNRTIVPLRPGRGRNGKGILRSHLPPPERKKMR